MNCIAEYAFIPKLHVHNIDMNDYLQMIYVLVVDCIQTQHSDKMDAYSSDKAHTEYRKWLSAMKIMQSIICHRDIWPLLEMNTLTLLHQLLFQTRLFLFNSIQIKELFHDVGQFIIRVANYIYINIYIYI